MDVEARVLELLTEKPHTNAELRAVLFPGSGNRYVVQLDRALQRLRKSSRIRVLVGNRWALNDVRPCPHCKGKGLVLAAKAEGR